MSPRNRSLIISTFLTFLIAGAVIYFVALKNTKTPISETLFQPEDVLQIDWQAENKFSFVRTNSTDKWSPDIDPTRIDTKLMAVSTMQLQKMAPAEDEINSNVTLTLLMKNGEKWQGIYQNENFIWVAGPHSGFGTNLSTAQSDVFKEGRYAFEPLSWSFCTSPIRKLTYEHDEEVVEIIKTSAGWELANLNGDAKITDSTTIEAWVQKACDVGAQSWLDLNIEAFGLDDGSFEVEYTSGTIKEFPMRSPVFQLGEDKAIISIELFQELEELLATP
jgi:hypothetical protein